MRTWIFGLVFLFLISFTSAYNISSCQIITAPGNYLIVNALSSSDTCLRIYASNVFIDGNHMIISGLRYNQSSGVEIANATNVYIKQLNILDFDTGIKGVDLNLLGLDTINIENTDIGLYLNNSFNTYLAWMGYENSTLSNEKFYNSTFVDVPLVPEFGFIIGVLTIVFAVVVFFFVRRQ